MDGCGRHYTSKIGLKIMETTFKHYILIIDILHKNPYSLFTLIFG